MWSKEIHFYDNFGFYGMCKVPSTVNIDVGHMVEQIPGRIFEVTEIRHNLYTQTTEYVAKDKANV